MSTPAPPHPAPSTPLLVGGGGGIIQGQGGSSAGGSPTPKPSTPPPAFTVKKPKPTVVTASELSLRTRRVPLFSSAGSSVAGSQDSPKARLSEPVPTAGASSQPPPRRPLRTFAIGGAWKVKIGTCDVEVCVAVLYWRFGGAALDSYAPFSHTSGCMRMRAGARVCMGWAKEVGGQRRGHRFEPCVGATTAVLLCMSTMHVPPQPYGAC